MMSTSYNSPARSPATTRLQLGGVSRLRSSSLKKPPEPLRRAVADSLSSSSSSSLLFLHGSYSSSSSEASRTLRDYLASHATTDLTYSVILDHTLAEKERSPAVVGRCVALLKRYLLRYKPSEETLHQIDRFCVNILVECELSSSRKMSLWSRSLSQHSRAPAPTVSPLAVSKFESGAIVKSLNFVRSLVAQYVPKRSFQPAALAGVVSASRHSLPTLSSLLSKSFNAQLSPGNAKEPMEKNEGPAISILNSPFAEELEGIEDDDFIAVDLFKWRWHENHQSSLLSADSFDRSLKTEDSGKRNFLEVGAAALLVGDMEAKMKGEVWRYFGTVDMPYLDQLLQPSLLTTVTNSAAADAHLRLITASKRSKKGPQQIWEDYPISTFWPRPRPLFQYRHYSEQQPLRLNPVEVGEVIAAVCSEMPSPIANFMTVSSKFNSNSGNPSMDVAVSVLIKLVIDMYVQDPGTAAPLALSMLEEMLCSTKLTSKNRAFDLIINLGVHAHLLEPILDDDGPTVEEDFSQETYLDKEEQLAVGGKRNPDYIKLENSAAIHNFESWILCILYEILLLLVQVEEKEESVWASALSCLLYFVCDKGQVHRSRLKGLDIRVIKMLITISRRNSWAEVVHCKLIGMLTNMFYQVPNELVTFTPIFLVDQVDLIGGIEFVFTELVLSNSREDRRNLYLVLFDYVLHQINENCIVAGVTEYSDDESQPIATLLTLADAPEALHISVKLGVEGIGELLRRSISTAFSRSPNGERLNMLLEKITENFDVLVRSFTLLDKEFTHMIQIAKSYKLMRNIEDAALGNSFSMKVKLAWATLHSLLHSDRAAIRQNGYVWLGDLLIAEISEGDGIWSNIRNFQQKIVLASVKDYSADLDLPVPIWLFCGLLKSKNNLIRWGFLFVLERLLMRCKFLLDENEMQNSISNEEAEHLHGKSRQEKANAVIDIMRSALSLVAQINETDRMNILKMCDILFSQLCLKVIPVPGIPSGDGIHDNKGSNFSAWTKKVEIEEHHKDKFVLEPTDTRGVFGIKNDTLLYETASMAALLLRGQAVVPMQLVSRVPADLFYWPLIQLAAAATDNIALGVSVGSKGRGNLPGATSDIRATLLLLLIGKCTADSAAFKEVGGEEFFRELLDDTDSRIAYYSSTFLLKRMMSEEPESYQRMLSSLVSRAQQSNNEKLLENPYLQMRGLLQLSNE